MFTYGDKIKEKATGRLAEVTFGGHSSVSYLITFEDNGKRRCVYGIELERQYELIKRRKGLN